MACVLIVGAMLVTVLLQVVFRYALRAPLPWTDELARYSLIWLTFIAAALVMGRRRHIAVHITVRLGPRPSRIVLIAVGAVVAATCALMAVLSISMMERWSKRISTVLELPMAAVVAALGVGFALMTVHAIAGMIADARLSDADVLAQFGDSTDEVLL
ncbi:MAG: TRAP transporter small permease [Pseudolysinimonas sp.]|uniref:TRAP transporter small permease n=1 Tax=Pseudolysinimonas sp. TaxID=2680009 RepID=UPI003C76D7AD